VYWCCAQLELHRERLALHTFGLAGFESYLPRIRTQRRTAGRLKPFEITTALFPGYCFVAIELQWHTARWSPGVLSLILAGEHPAHVPDHVINDLRAREVNGFVVLPQKDPGGFKRGDKVFITTGPMAGQLAVYAGMKPR
jgi:transcriptional antiterminator RfaH